MPSKRKIISLCLLAILSFGGMLMLTSCKTQTQNFTLKFVTTPLYADGDTAHYPYEVTFDSTMFENKPTQFSADLAKLSLVLSSAAYNYTDALDNLDYMGFEHKAKFNYADNYDQSGVGVIIASRQLGDITVCAVILRGTYGKEWYSNFDIGKDLSQSKVHSGFANATEFAMSKLEMYLVNYGIDRDHTKFLVTGHSRGAAVANLLSKKLIDTYGPDNIYAYTFATPNTTTSEDATDLRYRSIINFVNPEDFIAYVPPEGWGFTKYGTTITFPDSSSEGYEEKLSRVSQHYEQYKGRPFKTFGSTKMQEEFFEHALSIAPTVTDYYNTRYEIAGLQLSLYEYMNIVCHMLNEENIISNGLILLSSDSTVFEPLTKYIMSGMDVSDAMPSLDYEQSLIGYAHTAETYLAWLQIYTEDM